MIKKIARSKIEFKLTVPREKWEKYLDAAAAEISKEIKIAGFRPGKAPRKMVEQKVGAGAVLNSAAQMAAEKSYADFVLENKLDVLGTPEVEMEEIKEGKDLVFTARTAVMPEVSVKDKYKKEIQKINKKYAEKKKEVTDDELDLELEKLAASRAKLVTIRREAKKDDRVEIDFSVLIGGVPIENGTSKNHPLVIGKEVFIPGFEDNLIGLNEGEEKEFELAFPENYHQKELAGKKAVFKVKMKLVQERQISPIDDDFAKSLGNFQDLEALKKNIRHGMEHELEHKMQDQKRTEYLDKIVENTEVDLPEILIRQETDKMLHEFGHQVQSMGMDLEQYLEKIGKKRDELAHDWNPQAEKRVKSALALREIIKMEKISVDAGDIEAEMNKTLQYYKNLKDAEKNIDTEKLYNYTKGVLENEKVFQMLEKI